MAAMLPMACSQFAIPGWASHQPSAVDREPLIHTIQSILVIYRRHRRLAIVMAARHPDPDYRSIEINRHIREGSSPCSGKWYIDVDCARYGEPIHLGEVPSPEEEPELKFRTVADVPYPACGHTDTYAPDLMSRRPASCTPSAAEFFLSWRPTSSYAPRPID